MRYARATHLMHRTDYLPAYYGGRVVQVGVRRVRRQPRHDGEHWIFEHAGATRHAVFCRATPTHWLVRLHRSADRPSIITRLARSRWSPSWKVCVVYFRDAA